MLNELPNLYSKSTRKIKNKKLRRILQLDLANSLVDMGAEYSQQKFFFAESANNDVKRNFIGVFPSNFVNHFISFHDMISESGTKYPFVIMNTDQSDKKFRQLASKKGDLYVCQFWF